MDAITCHWVWGTFTGEAAYLCMCEIYSKAKNDLLVTVFRILKDIDVCGKKNNNPAFSY